MEGEQGSKAGQDQSPSPEPEKPSTAAPEPKSWRSRLAKIPLPARVAAAIGITLGSGAAIGVGVNEATGGKSESNEPTATIQIDKPPTATIQVVEITPKETAKPTPTPSPESPKPTATPAASSVSETPIPTPPQTETLAPVENKPSGVWEIAPRSPNSQVSQEDWNQAKLVIESAFEKFPHIGNINVYIVEGMASSALPFSQDPQKPSIIFFGALGNTTNILNELSGYFRLNLNSSTLALNYKPETLSRMQELDPAIIAPYTDYSPENIFGEKMLHGSAYSRAASVPYTFYVGQSIDLPTEGGQVKYPLERPLFAETLDSPLYAQFAQETQGKINNSSNFEQFAQDQNNRLEQLKAAGPLHKLAIDWLEQNAALLKYANVLSGPSLHLDDKYLSDYFAQVLPAWENYALTRLFDQRDPGLLANFTDEQIQNFATNYQMLLDAVENEIFIRALNMQIQQVTNDPAAAEYYQLIWQNFQQ